MHWAAAFGRLDVVQRLADGGGDVVGLGDRHELEVIGWATCWNGCDDAAHRAVANFLVSRGARHHIFSAISMNLAEEVRRIVAADPSNLDRRQSRYESNRTPLQFAVVMNRQEMVTLLLNLGADPLALDAWGQSVAAFVIAPDTDRSVMEKIRTIALAELASAEREHRPPHVGPIHLIAVLALRDWDSAEQLFRTNTGLIEAHGGVLHLMSKRNDVTAVKWLLERGADPNGRWAHWDAEVTPLHLAAFRGNVQIARLLLAAGSDPSIRDTKDDCDAIDWARQFEQTMVVQILNDRSVKG